MKSKRLMLLVLALALAFSVPAIAQGNGETTYRALLIGVEGYQTNALSGCIADTNRMSQALQAANEAGAFYQSPVIRTNLQTDEILQLTTELETWNVDEDDVTFFYFAGHGYMSDKGTPGIVGRDSKMLRISELIGLLDTVPGTKVVVLDCRYADSLIGKAETDAASVLSKFNKAIVDEFAACTNAVNYYVLAASTLASCEEMALNAGEEPRGLATYLLTQGCGYDYVEQRPTDALPADANGNGAVSLTEARDYIEAEKAGLSRASEIVMDLAISPEGSTYPLLARRATSEVLEVTLKQTSLDIPIGRTRQLDVQTQPPNASMRTVFWTSSDLSVATVDEDGAVTGHKPGTARIAATTANGLTVSADVEVRDVTLVDSLTLNTGRLTVGRGSEVALGLTVLPADADEGISWTSADSSVVSVDENGNLSCLTNGETHVTVASESGVEATCAVKVVDPDKVVTAIQVSKNEIQIFEGESRVVQSKIRPAKAEDPQVTFTSSDPTVAEITGDSIISGVSDGECVVYATASSGISAQIKVRVSSASIELSKQSLAMKRGTTATLQTKLKPQGLSAPITWESSDPAVATVENGKVTAVTSGKADIIAKLDSGVNAVCRVMVDGVAVKQVAIRPAKVSLEVGATSELKASVKPTNATIQDMEWSSGNEQVVQVDEDGLITAMSAGRAVVTATSHNGVKAKCQVTVKGISVSEVSLDFSEIELVVGLAGQNKIMLNANTEPAAAGNGSLKWASSNPKVAAVDNTGTVTAKSAGKAIIKATAQGAGKNGKSATCNVTVSANRVLNKKPIVGAERELYTSARRIQYKQGYLVVELCFSNRTGKAVTVPEAGDVMLTLADGRTLLVQSVEAGKKKLKAGKNGMITYKVKVEEGDELYGLDLRGASAQLVTDDMPADAGTPAPTDMPADQQPSDDNA